MANEFVSDVNDLDLGVAEPINWDEYQDAAERKITPQPGKYDLELPKEFKYKRGRDGQLVIAVDPLTIVGPDNQGYQIKYTSVSTKKFKNSNACQAGDLLRNAGSVAQPNSPKEWAMAFEDVAGVVCYGVDCIYRGWDKVAQKEYEQKLFPKREDGTIQPYLDLPEVDATTGQPVLNDQGEPKTRRVFANLIVNVRGFAIKKA